MWFLGIFAGLMIKLLALQSVQKMCGYEARAGIISCVKQNNTVTVEKLQLLCWSRYLTFVFTTPEMKQFVS